MQYTRSRAEVENVEGGKYSVLDGKIVGRFLTLRKGEYIKMEWKFSEWKSFSIVELILREEEEDECDLFINQSKIPPGEPKEKLEAGWKHHIIEPLSKILGYPLKD
jgi:activator of HSP90 ATPase